MPVARRGTPPSSQIKEDKSVLTSLSAWTDNGEEEKPEAKKGSEYIRLEEEGAPVWKSTLAKFTDPDSDSFNIVVGTVILANALVIGLETEFGDDKFKFFEHSFNAVFFTEMCLRLRALRCGYFQEPWNIFDFTLVCTGTLDLWVLPLFVSGSSRVLYRFSVMRMLRILRLMRILRVVRLFRMFQQLYLIMQAFNKAFQIVLLMGLLVAILNYVCAILLTQSVGHNAHLWEDDEERAKITAWFGGIGCSMQTLFQIMTLSNFNDISTTLVQVLPPALVYIGLALYIMVTSYTMISLITGIISESLITATQEYRMRKEVLMEHKKKELCNELGVSINDILEDEKDDYNNVPPESLKMAMRGDTELLSKLTKIGINMDERGILNLIDNLANESQTIVNVDYFIDKLTALQGTASASTVMDLKYDIFKLQSKIELLATKASGKWEAAAANN